MKRRLPILVVLLAAAFIARAWMPQKSPAGAADLSSLGQVSVLVGGRVKPLDTVARNSLLIIHGKQELRLADGKRISAMQWLTDVIFNAGAVDEQPAFVIHHPEVLGLFGWEQGARKNFSYQELMPFLRQIEEQGSQAEKLQSAERSSYQSAILNLRNALILYQKLKHSIQPEGAQNFIGELERFLAAVPEGGKAARQREAGEPFDQAKLEAVAEAVRRYEEMSGMAYVLAVPSRSDSNQWHSIGDSLLQSIGAGEIHPVVRLYAQIGDACRSGASTQLNEHVTALRTWMEKEKPRAASRSSFEFLFNHLQPFSQSMTLYVLAFLLACGSWLAWSETLRRSAFWLLLLGLAIHTFGIIARMYLQERPPVTNLYSSAVFIGWGTVVVALILERTFRDGIGAACAGAVGFGTLIIAHHLAGSGDTLEMLQAVLDTNIWLATHVVAITTGYSAMFLAGMLAIIYILRGVFTRSLDRATADSLARMTYGVVCFATLFSFVGTVLGGIWADQSWGRFWGWDPKENGALLIVLWCAITLHARWGGFIAHRGLMVMAIFGNIITSFSWFGVNMLGVGLHSYGFMQKAFPWLVGFMISQLVLMAIGGLPLARWRSFRTGAPHRKDQPTDLKFVPPGLAVETTTD
ncbi:MAG TPA: cytochrome c biogenesis protein CcsA [Chthoniobacterales bacterium]|nr:cytochrome c biogenesis protein CcsA [Chthoniobacterales bacterium]